MKKITIVFAPDGSTKIDAAGFSGKACLKATEAIEQAIGATLIRKPKPEMGTATATAEQTVGQE